MTSNVLRLCGDHAVEELGECWICGKPDEPLEDPLHIDHHHETGKVRRLLCAHCNQGIGSFAEDVNRLRKAIEYLEETS